MIVYCAGPIRGDVKYQKYLKTIINHVDIQGHTALSELNKEFRTSIPLTEEQIFTRDIKWIERSKVLVAEISGPSLGVGFEICYALFTLKLPVLAVYNKEIKKVSSMIVGCNSKLLTIKSYEDAEELKSIIDNYLTDRKKIEG